MKSIKLTTLIFLLFFLFGAKVIAHDIEVMNESGVTIYYSWINNYTELAVTYCGEYDNSYSNEYSGNVVIPKTVDYYGVTYKVTKIGDYTFSGCKNLYSVTIPNSVTSINRCAFSGCLGLNSVIIGSGVVTIDNDAFYNCYPTKIIWLTNTPPKGSEKISAKINYVSNDQYSIKNIEIYPFLSSYFDVGGIIYVPVSPSERNCDAIDCIYDGSASNIKISSTVTYQGITMGVRKVQPYICYRNTYIKDLIYDINGVVSSYAFYGCSNIKNIDLGNNISSINIESFGGCSSLQKIIIPNSVTEVGHGAFSNCQEFTKITIPKSVTSLKNNVFKGCYGLKEFIIEDRSEELELGYNNDISSNLPFFSDCPLDSIYIGGNITYNTSSNCGYSPFYRNTSLRTVVITDNETEISENEFYGCTNLQNFRVGDGVTKFGDWAFSGCSSLKSLSFGSQLKDIGKEAFSDCVAVREITSKAITPPNCGNQALDDINKWSCTLIVPYGSKPIYEVADQWKDFFYISEAAAPRKIEVNNIDGKKIFYEFKNNKKELAVSYKGDNYYSYNNEYSGNVVLPEYVKYNGVTYPVTSIEPHAFYNCTSLSSITIPNSVTSIGEHAFDETGLTTIVSQINNPFIIYGRTSDNRTFSVKTFNNATLYIPVGTIEKYKSTEGWQDFTYIEEIKPQKVEAKNADGQMLYYLFKNNKEFAVTYRGDEWDSYDEEYYGDIVIPEYVEYNGVTYPVTTIEPYAFVGCIGLTSVIIPNTVTSIGENAFFSCVNLTSLAIGNKVKEIGEYAFDYCESLTSIIIPCSVSLIGFNAFARCSALKSIIVEKGNSIYDSRDNCNAIIETSTNSLIKGCKNTFIPNTVTSIGTSAFDSCRGLTSITIPNSVTNIKDWAFNNCINLTSITIPNSVTRISIAAFADTGLTSITIPKSVQIMEATAFFGVNLTSVISLIEEPFEIYGPFDENTYNNGILYVPVGSKEKYENTYGWNKFVHIQEGNPNYITQIYFNDVLIQNNGNVLKISGAPRDSKIYVYNLLGQKVGSARVMSESTDVVTSLLTGEVGIVKIGEKCVRVVIK